jgi:alkyl sulfatase BDS1-like metallo-beta-lactamase superfamily hydrolase
MREISLPGELSLPEVHGKVSWGVRSLFNDYTGWFHLQSTTELYDVPRTAVDPEIVDMAGGPAAVAARGAEHLEKGPLDRARSRDAVRLLGHGGDQAAQHRRAGGHSKLLMDHRTR